MKSIEELALKVADQVQFSTSKPFTCDQIVDFATRFLAAYAEQQEPVATVVRGAHGTTSVYGQLILDLPHGTTLYAAPVVPADMVLVPREPTEAMIGNEWNRDMLAGIWRAMIAAGEKS